MIWKYVLNYYNGETSYDIRSCQMISDDRNGEIFTMCSLNLK